MGIYENILPIVPICSSIHVQVHMSKFFIPSLNKLCARITLDFFSISFGQLQRTGSNWEPNGKNPEWYVWIVCESIKKHAWEFRISIKSFEWWSWVVWLQPKTCPPKISEFILDKLLYLKIKTNHKQTVGHATAQLSCNNRNYRPRCFTRVWIHFLS